MASVEFVLLCHSRELVKKSNTGQLVMAQAGVTARLVEWSRTAPDPQLLRAIARDNCWLLYPRGESVVCVNCVPESQLARAQNSLTAQLGDNPVIVLIDATWQQAQKMYNQSPYLQGLPALALRRDRPSMFRLRRNQKPEGLCTVECVVELLYLAGERPVAQALEEAFQAFMAQPKNLPTR